MENLNRFSWTPDTELQQKIELEIKMREGTAKLLAASNNPLQALEAAKNLLTSNSRVLSYMSELQKQKTEEVLKQSISDGSQVPCKAKVSLSDIRIPLMWKDTDHFKNKGDHRRYAVFCLVKIGTDIQDTTLIKEVDRSMTDICFEDVLVFSDVNHDFKCTLEVYSHNLSDDLTIASTPKKIKKKFDDFSSNIGRRLSGLRDDDILDASMLMGPRFELVGRSTLSLSDVRDVIGTFDLQRLDPPPSPNEYSQSCSDLPLFGNFCTRLAAQPYCLVEDTVSGILTIKEGELWEPYWCRLCNLQISCWQEQDRGRAPVKVIPVTKDCQISDLPSDRPYAIRILNSRSRDEQILCALNKTKFDEWWDGLQQHLLDQVLWNPACDKRMEIPNPTKGNAVFKRKASLYDQVQLKERRHRAPAAMGHKPRSPPPDVLPDHERETKI